VPQTGPVTYDVKVNGRAYRVEVSAAGTVTRTQPAADTVGAGDAVPAGLAGTVIRILVEPGERVSSGQPLLVLEAMKMEMEISAPRDGEVVAVRVAVGDSVAVGDPLVSLG
jgi:oxaloacetate decarboxylase alpha subunit